MQDKPLEKRAGHSLLLVRLIAVGKVLKAASLLIIGYFLLHMLHVGGTLHDTLKDIVDAVRMDPSNTYIHNLLEKATGVSNHTLREVAVGTLIYSGLYLVEGIGLFMDKGWAEWMTVITTLGFIPVEIHELSKGLTVGRVTVFILNILILIYITLRIRWRHLAKVEAKAQGLPVKEVVRHPEVVRAEKPATQPAG